MNFEEKIVRHIQELPESKKAEALDFVEYLRSKAEENDCLEFSTTSAMRGMENEVLPYTLEDIKEFFYDCGGPDSHFLLTSRLCVVGSFGPNFPIWLALVCQMLGGGWSVIQAEFGVHFGFAGMVFVIITGGTIFSSIFSSRNLKQFGTG
jgi:hypothetical protein